MYKHTHKKDIENVLILQGGGSRVLLHVEFVKHLQKKE